MAATPHTGSARRHEAGSGEGVGFLESIARAIIHEDPPLYSRGAWAIISDVPYPGPPPYAGSRCHPPTYDEAMEIGVVASPLRIAQRMHCQSCQPPCTSASTSIGRAASAPELSAISSTSADVLPAYGVEADTVPLSPVVRSWQLGEPALDKPPMDLRGYRRPGTARRH